MTRTIDFTPPSPQLPRKGRAKRPVPPEVLRESASAEHAEHAEHAEQGALPVVGVTRDVSLDEMNRRIAEAAAYKAEMEARVVVPGAPGAPGAPAETAPPAAVPASVAPPEAVAPPPPPRVGTGRPGRITREEAERRRKARMRTMSQKAANRRFAIGLFKIRESRAMRQEDLAKAAHLDPLTVSRVENCHNPPTTSTANRLAKALKVDPSQLFEERPLVPSLAPAPAPSALERLLGAV